MRDHFCLHRKRDRAAFFLTFKRYAQQAHDALGLDPVHVYVAEGEDIWPCPLHPGSAEAAIHACTQAEPEYLRALIQVYANPESCTSLEATRTLTFHEMAHVFLAPVSCLWEKWVKPETPPEVWNRLLPVATYGEEQVAERLARMLVRDLPRPGSAPRKHHREAP